eukprot:2444892-Prorocentrum_lima.AAC.1
MKHNLHLQGTVLKPGQKGDQQDVKKKSINNDTIRLDGSIVEAQPIPEQKEWSTCTKEQVLNQLDVFFQKEASTSCKD